MMGTEDAPASVWVSAYFQGRTVKYSECIYMNLCWFDGSLQSSSTKISLPSWNSHLKGSWSSIYWFCLKKLAIKSRCFQLKKIVWTHPNNMFSIWPCLMSRFFLQTFLVQLQAPKNDREWRSLEKSFPFESMWATKEGPLVGWVCRGWWTTQLYRDYNKPL